MWGRIGLKRINNAQFIIIRLKAHDLRFIITLVGCGLEKKEGQSDWIVLLFFSFVLLELATEAQFFNDSTVAFDVNLFQIVEHTTTFTYQHTQSTFSAIIFTI